MNMNFEYDIAIFVSKKHQGQTFLISSIYYRLKLVSEWDFFIETSETSAEIRSKSKPISALTSETKVGLTRKA